MKKKADLTEPEIFYIIHSDDSDEVAAEKVDCAKRTIANIRAANPKLQPNTVKVPTLAEQSRTFTANGESVHVMRESVASLSESEIRRMAKTAEAPKPDYITKVRED